MLVPATNVSAASLLKTGSSGEDVATLQTQLHKMGFFKTTVNGYYDRVTKQAIEKFQKERGLVVDGIAGPMTLGAVENINEIAHIVHGEARGETYEGQVAVAAVILNRVESDKFPDSIKNVIYQENAFSAVNDGQYRLPPDHYAYRATIDALNGWDPSRGSTYYYNPDIATDEWIFTRTTVKSIHNHVFAR
ncbi:cell wall hydrolase [Pseudalkalibacillus caeni]|uniref:Cell wall hydrolase n=2 Tax=Exobacillus caeni TaxID=2574798 RepID=A0A5R9EXZ0_9BACL|nr:cell wall hydrolase [Pseudalkalibacillus caeni]